MKRSVMSFIMGSIIFGSVGVFAGQYTAVKNPYPVKLNGTAVKAEGYNINGSTYFKLRDIADSTGKFNVDFANEEIRIATDGYTYPKAEGRPNGWYLHKETDPNMSIHSESLYFGSDGSFKGQTWRSKYEGTYTVSGNTVNITYDVYYCGAGEKTYTYYYSGKKKLTMQNGVLKGDNNTTYSLVSGSKDPYENISVGH